MGTNTIPAGGKLILAQTSVENFDGSDTNSAGCFNCNPNDCSTKVSSAVPVVHVTIGSKTTDYVDPGQILNTHGVDAAGCPYTGTRNDESSPWTQIYPRLAAAAGTATDSATDARMSAPGAPEFVWLAPLAPNPSRGVLQVAFRTATRGNVRLEVYDVAGRLVLTGLDGVLEAGGHHQQLNLSGASAGIYYCNLSTAQGSRRSAFVLVR